MGQGTENQKPKGSDHKATYCFAFFYSGGLLSRSAFLIYKVLWIVYLVC